MFTRKLLVLVLFITFLNCLQSFAYSNIDYLSNVEQNLFGTQFKKETISKRLNRIEMNIFGKTSKAPVEQRIQKIKTVIAYIGPVKPVKQVTKPKPITPIKSKSIVKQNLGFKYPAVTELESKVLKRTFENEDIYKRVDRLEMAVFNSASQDALNDRVDRLRNTVLGNQNNRNSTFYNDTSDSDDGNTPQMDSQTINATLSQVENETFNQTFANESIEARLERLENKLFNQTSPDDPVSDRIERISAVVAAQPTSDLYKDMSQLRQYQQVGAGMTAATVLLLLLQGLLH